MARRQITIQTCGGAGDGSVATGALIARAAVKLGYSVLVYDTFPAEIRGFGKTISEVRVSVEEVTARADAVDVLIGLNNVFAIEQIKTLAEDAVIIYDSLPGITVKESESVPHFAGNYMSPYGVPLEHTAQRVTGRKLGKNVVAVGFLAKLLGLPKEPFHQVLKELFLRKGEKVLSQNIALFDEGYAYEEVEYRLIELEKAPPPGEERVIISGNDAMTRAAVNASLAVFAGYPITPASKLMENLAKELPRYGGIVVQTEDEIAAIGAVTGAWFAGKRAMTATSGPGLSLMSEIINLGVMTETPLVIVNAMRGGPSTGLPTKVEQADLNIALWGGHGDSPRVVLAPTNIAESYAVLQDAFDVAEKYQTPVIVLTDKFIAMSHTSVPASILEEKRGSTRLEYTGPPEAYRRFAITETGVSPWVVPGTPGISYTTSGLEHDETGAPGYDVPNHVAMTEKRFRKFRAMLGDLPAPVFEGPGDGKNLVVSWGSSFGAVEEGVKRLWNDGYSIRLCKMTTIFPQHEDVMRGAFERAEKVIVVEQNRFGQLAKFLKGYYGISADEVHLPGGEPPSPGEVTEAVKERLLV